MTQTSPSKFIFLDDYRKPSDVKWQQLPIAEWQIVRNYDEFVSLLNSLETAPEYVAFDHDLADAHYRGDFSNPDEKTGLHCARYLKTICAEKGWQLPRYSCHSLNPVGKSNILKELDNA